MIKLSDTIAAIATGMNQGGIGVIRVSGEHAIDISDSIFIPKINGKEIQAIKNNKVYKILIIVLLSVTVLALIMTMLMSKHGKALFRLRIL